MANLDSENKRRSATGIFHIYTIPPAPDGTIALLDMVNATFVYAGITIQTTIVRPIYNFIAKSIPFNFNAENTTFNFNAKSKTFGFTAEPGP